MYQSICRQSPCEGVKDAPRRETRLRVVRLGGSMESRGVLGRPGAKQPLRRLCGTCVSNQLP